MLDSRGGFHPLLVRLWFRNATLGIDWDWSTKVPLVSLPRSCSAQVEPGTSKPACPRSERKQAMPSSLAEKASTRLLARVSAASKVIQPDLLVIRGADVQKLGPMPKRVWMEVRVLCKWVQSAKKCRSEPNWYPQKGHLASAVKVYRLVGVHAAPARKTVKQFNRQRL